MDLAASVATTLAACQANVERCFSLGTGCPAGTPMRTPMQTYALWCILHSGPLRARVGEADRPRRGAAYRRRHPGMDDPIRYAPSAGWYTKSVPGVISHPARVHQMKSLRVHADGTRRPRRHAIWAANEAFPAGTPELETNRVNRRIEGLARRWLAGQEWALPPSVPRPTSTSPPHAPPGPP